VFILLLTVTAGAVVEFREIQLSRIAVRRRENLEAANRAARIPDVSSELAA
jgi:hypothetical protein